MGVGCLVGFVFYSVYVAYSRLALCHFYLLVLSSALTASRLPHLAVFAFFPQSDTAPPSAASYLVYLLPQKYKSGSNPKVHAGYILTHFYSC